MINLKNSVCFLALMTVTSIHAMDSIPLLKDQQEKVVSFEGTYLSQLPNVLANKIISLAEVNKLRENDPSSLFDVEDVYKDCKYIKKKGKQFLKICPVCWPTNIVASSTEKRILFKASDGLFSSSYYFFVYDLETKKLFFNPKVERNTGGYGTSLLVAVSNGGEIFYCNHEEKKIYKLSPNRLNLLNNWFPSKVEIAPFAKYIKKMRYLENSKKLWVVDTNGEESFIEVEDVSQKNLLEGYLDEKD